jgi:hypothetical protein
MAAEMNLTRVWEIFSGAPHLRLNADRVKAATSALSRKTDELESAIKPYAQSEDPLAMFMTDVFNRRGMLGSSNAKIKFHP